MDRKFLTQVATTYYTKIQESNELSLDRICFVFPNRRAGLFFKRELQKIITKPIFAPRILNINDLFLRYSNLMQTDKVNLIFVLYDIYCKHINNTEHPQFTDFISIGDIIIRDFDELDKYMIDAKTLFSNIEELKNISSDYLTDDQKELIRKFWGHVIPDKENTPLYNTSFVGLWSKLYNIYIEFKAELRKKGIGYDGMIFRDVVSGGVDGIDKVSSTKNTCNLEFEYDRYVFIGFNGLNTTEETLLKAFSSVGDYYFDYPQWLRDMKDTAGYFAEKNTSTFKSLYSLDNDNQDSSDTKELHTYSIPSNVGQVELLPIILENIGIDCKKENPTENKEIETAIILPDEKLLMPTIYALPEFNSSINITMGYPLNNTPIATLVTNVIQLYKNKRKAGFYYKSIIKVLNHQLLRSENSNTCHVDKKTLTTNDIIDKINNKKLIYANAEQLGVQSTIHKDDILQILFSYEESNDNNDFIEFLLQLLNCIYVGNSDNNIIVDSEEDNSQQSTKLSIIDIEYISKYISILKHIQKNIQEYSISQNNIYEIITQMTMVSNVPFNGEPVQGLQIMGALESRLLDFQNIIIFSFNDEKIPKKQELNSLIPYNLRCAYNLPTSEYNDRLYAYNFYRMLYRVKNIHCIYDSRTENVSNNNEISRFYYQIKYLYHNKFNITDHNVKYNSKDINDDRDITFDKRLPAIKNKLEKYFTIGKSVKYLSPSSINNYINCPLMFLFANVLNVRQDKELNEEVDLAELGSIFHKCMENIYKEYNGKQINYATIESFKSTNIENIIDSAIKQISKVNDIKGITLLNKIIVKDLVRSTLEYDKKRAPFKYITSEKLITDCQLPINIGNVTRNLNFKGFIDRIDEKDRELYIIDYKTGKMDGKMKVKSIASLFENTKNRPKEVLQTILYCYVIDKFNDKFNDLSNYPLVPHIYSVKNYNNSDIEFTEKEDTQSISAYIKEILPEFETRLNTILEEIFNEDIPFKQTENKDNCEWCQFVNICTQQATQEHDA